MNIVLETKRFSGLKSDLHAVLLSEEDVKKKRFPYNEILQIVKRNDFKGEFKDIYLLSGDAKKKRVLLVGTGKDLDAEKLRKLTHIIVAKGRLLKVDDILIRVEEYGKFSSKRSACSIVEGAVLGEYAFSKYKTETKKKPKRLKRLTLFYGGNENLKPAIQDTKKICDNSNYVRDIINYNAEEMTTTKITDMAKEIAKSHGLKITVFDEKKLQDLGMNLILAVGRGSINPQRLVILEYKGDPSHKDVYAIVGKGITFDTGGINLKPSGYIENMKLDKSGAITVLATMKTLSEINAHVNVVGVMPLCENAVGSKAYLPGDVFKSYSGKTVEVCDTDAEGRLILADALAYTSKTYKPKYMIDLATLTGSVMITFGEYIAGLCSNDKDLSKKLYDAGEKTFERVWELPLYEEYIEEMKGDVSDIKNLGYKGGRYAGAITAAAFLSNFIGKTKWAHLDIAGTAWYEKTRSYIPKGPTGYGVRLLIEFFKKQEKIHRIKKAINK